MSMNDVIDRIQRVISKKAPTVALHEPHFIGNEWTYVKECLDTGWVSSAGKFVDRFEQMLASVTGAQYAVVTANGTLALHMMYLLAGIQPHDEVLVPTLTFVGTINALRYCGAIPHFVDAEMQTLGIDHEHLSAYLREITIQQSGVCMNRFTGRPIKALCAMHTLGHPADLDALEALCDRHHLLLLEDAAEALGSYYKGTHVGHRGLMGILSFNGNKIVTTGGGGAILTNHARLAKRAKHLTTTAKKPHAWAFEHDAIGFNYRLPNLNAALGCAQLEKLFDFLSAKRLLATQYQQVFADCEVVACVREPADSKSNYWMNAILLNDEWSSMRDQMLAAMHEKGILARPIWNLQHTLKMFQDCPRMPLPIAEQLQKRLITIPSSASLGNVQ